MSITQALGEARTVQTPAGAIAYRESGQGSVIVFVHGVGMTGDLGGMAPQLSERHRCICPDLPLGAHRERISPDTEMSLPGLARILAGFLEALDLEDLTIVANDTGGAISSGWWATTASECPGWCSPPATPSTSTRRIPSASLRQWRARARCSGCWRRPCASAGPSA